MAFERIGFEDATPNAAKTIRNLRGSTYDLNSAVADLIDNSLDARATKVLIEIPIDGSSILVIDDGVGMSDDIHRESMKLAAQTRTYDSRDLAKFGTGMKAAALSLGGRLVVATKTVEAKRISARCLDQEHIEREDDWKTATLVMSEQDLPRRLHEQLRSWEHGTAILIEQVDRAFGEGSHGSTDKHVPSYLADLEKHLQLIFHRFLDGSHENRQLDIRLNGVSVLAWDPYCLSPELSLDAETEVWPEREIDLGLGRRIRIQGYVLPRKDEFRSASDHAKAAGPKGWNNSQGFYVYRNGRLLRWGGWLRLRATDEHLKLVRVRIDFDSALDELFSVNVAKSQVNLPKALKRRIDEYVAPIAKRGQERYRTKNRVVPPPRPGGTPAPPQRTFRARELARAIDAILVARDPETLHLLKELVSRENKAMAEDIGWNHDDHR